MAICVEVTEHDRILISGPATITLQANSPVKRSRLYIAAEKDVVIVKEKIPV